MKIAFVCRQYHRKGGIARCVAELASRLSQNNEVHVFTSFWEKTLPDNRIIFHKIQAPRQPLFMAVFIFAITSFLKLRKQKFDLLVAPTGETLIKQAIFTAHSCHKTWTEFKKKSFIEYFRYLLNPLHRIILFLENYNFKSKNYQQIIAVSDFIKKEIIKYYNLPQEKVSVIYNGVDLEEFHPRLKTIYKAQIHSLHRIPEDKLMLLFVGYEFKRKGLKYLLQALSYLKDKKWCLLVVGKQPDFKYLRLIERLEISDKVIFIDKTSKINQYFAASDVFILPTLLEPFGLVVAEAMACGIPVIVSKGAGVSELIDDGEDGILLKNPQDVEELKGKILFLLENSKLRDNLGKKARSTIEKYNWNNIAEKTKQLYDTILKTRPGNV